MNWDEKAEDYAVAHHTYEHLTPDENAYYTSGFVRGARWQRQALLSDDAVERVARAMDENFNPDRHPIMAAMFRDYAKTALTAAIGDDGE